MKLIYNLLGISLFLFSTAFAANAQPASAQPAKIKPIKETKDGCCGYYLDVNIAYFRPNKQILRDIYSSSWVYGKVNFDATLANNIFCNTSALFWSDIGFMYQEGNTSDGTDSCYRAIPLTIGGKLNYCICNWELYAGLGMRFFFVRTTDCSGFVDDELRKTAFGGATTFGARYLFSNCLYFNTFIDYSFQANITQPDQQTPFVQGTTLDVSGLAIGAGIGVKF